MNADEDLDGESMNDEEEWQRILDDDDADVESLASLARKEVETEAKVKQQQAKPAQSLSFEQPKSVPQPESKPQLLPNDDPFDVVDDGEQAHADANEDVDMDGARESGSDTEGEEFKLEDDETDEEPASKKSKRA